MSYTGKTADGRDTTWDIRLTRFCGKCKSSLYTVLLGQGTIMHTDQVIWARSGCCGASVNMVLDVVETSKVFEDIPVMKEKTPEPQWRVADKAGKDGEWSGQVALAYGAPKKGKKPRRKS